MLPTYAVYSDYRRKSSATHTEAADLVEMLSRVVECSQEAGIDCEPHFVDTTVGANERRLFKAKLDRELRLRTRISRWLRGELWPSTTFEEETLGFLGLPPPPRTLASDLGSMDSFAVAALEMLNRTRPGYYSRGRKVSSAIEIHIWRHRYNTFECWVDVRRFEDNPALALGVELFSIDAWDDMSLRPAATDFLSALEASGQFERYEGTW